MRTVSNLHFFERSTNTWRDSTPCHRAKSCRRAAHGCILLCSQRSRKCRGTQKQGTRVVMIDLPNILYLRRFAAQGKGRAYSIATPIPLVVKPKPHHSEGILVLEI